MKQHGLVALNTWDSSQGPSYASISGVSRIDYICTRKQLADGKARDTQYLWDAPFQPLHRVGHAVLVGHVALYWIPSTPQPFGLTPHQKLQGRLAKMTNSATWQQYVATIGPDICGHLTQVLTSDADDLLHVHEYALKQFSRFFPATSQVTCLSPWQQNPITTNKWTHRKMLTQIRGQSNRAVFRAWFHVCRFMALNRQHRRFAYHLRRMKFEELLQEACQAATKHDTHRLFDLINRHSPKAPKRRLQLRNEQGHPITPSEERSLLIAFVRDTWRGDPLPMPAPGPPTGVPFTIQDLVAALKLIPTGKAVAAPCAPGPTWNSTADMIAPVLYAILNRWWSHDTPWIPVSWRSGWLQLIPKPNKPPVRPANLRPLAMMCPLGKAVMGLLIQMASRQADDEFRRWPIWAFMAHRSTQDPLAKVALHCRAARQLVLSQRSTPHSRAMQTHRMPICGGLQVFIDLERAFDSVNRVKLFQKLSTLGIDCNITRILHCWHVDTAYFVSHDGESVPVQVQKGLRQGCKGAPFLWNSLMVLMLHELQTHLPYTWICDHLTIYADDCHIGGLFTNGTELDFLLRAIGILFTTLHEFDLKLNPQKSAAILALHGPKSRQTRAKLLHRDHSGVKIKIPMPNDTHMLIPMQTQTTYLGCIMGYGQFEDSTTWHRVKLAWIGFQRLRKWLCSNHLFPLRHRYRLWRACIVPIMTYGVFAVGTTPKGIQHMLTQLGKMTRLIARDHAHHTGHTNEFVYSHFSLPRPADVLTTAADSLLQSVAQRQLIMRDNDIARRLDWHHLLTISQLIETAQATLLTLRAETALSGEVRGTEFAYHCQMCQFGTNDTSAFRRHCTTMHGVKMFRTHDTTLALHATAGLPQCKHCNFIFSTWRSFRIHIERGCQAIHLGPPPCAGANIRMPPRHETSGSGHALRGTHLLTTADLALLRSKPWGDRVLKLIADDALERLEHEHEACQFLSRCCFLCGLQVHRAQDAQLHFKTEHAEYWTHVPQKAIVLTNLHSDTPCVHCGSPFRTHTCLVWTQISIMILHGGGLTLSDADMQPELVQRCDICHEVFPDAARLTQHLQQQHRLAGISFNAARDCLDAQAACAHCGAPHASLESLRSHICQGRCPMFNPMATSETKPITQAMFDICIQGELFQQLRAPMTRLHLTLRCLHCPQVYKRACDLANHLMSNHSRLWRQAQGLTLLLVELVFARHGCQCNPQINQIRNNHICLPLRQIAMAFCRMDPAPFMPVQITEQALIQVAHPSIPRDKRFILTQLLANRDFRALWTQPEALDMLRNACVLCGQTIQTGMLNRHLHEAHLTGHQFVEFYSSTLLPLLHASLSTDYKCDLCLQIFNLPITDPDLIDNSRLELVQTHLRGNCPVALQCALILSTILNGGRLGDEWMGREFSCPNPRNIPVLDPPAGQVTQAAAESQAAEESQDGTAPSGRASRSRSARPRSNTASQVPASLGSAGPPSRAQLESDAKHRLFYPVLSARPGKCPPGTADGDSRVATTEAIEPFDHDLNAAPTPVPAPPAGPSQSNDEGFQEQAGGGPVPGLSRSQPDPGGHELALSAMGPDQKEPHCGQEEICADEQDAGAPDGADRGISRPDTGGPIPGPEHQSSTGHSPMEATAESAQQPPLRPDEGTDTLVSVAPGGHLPESPFDAAERAGEAGSTTPPVEPQEQRSWEIQEQGQEVTGELTPETIHALRVLVSHMTLRNDTNWCYANTTMYGLLWTLLSLNSCEAFSWGPHFKPLMQFIFASKDISLALIHFPWFVQLLETWGFTQAQQDCSEFVRAAILWLDSPEIDLKWERRFEHAGTTRCHDCSHACMPVILQFTPQLSTMDVCKLDDLLHHWHQANGMRAALLRAAPIVCIHVDRLTASETGQIEKSSCAIELDAETTIPVFNATGTDCEPVSYLPIAAASHQGLDQAGHYQALLKIQPTVLSAHPVQWLLTQDNQQPQACWEIPTGFRENLTVIWLIKADNIQVPFYVPPDIQESPVDLEAQILTLLNSTGPLMNIQ